MAKSGKFSRKSRGQSSRWSQRATASMPDASVWTKPVPQEVTPLDDAKEGSAAAFGPDEFWKVWDNPWPRRRGHLADGTPLDVGGLAAERTVDQNGGRVPEALTKYMDASAAHGVGAIRAMSPTYSESPGNVKRTPSSILESRGYDSNYFDKLTSKENILDVGVGEVLRSRRRDGTKVTISQHGLGFEEVREEMYEAVLLARIRFARFKKLLDSMPDEVSRVQLLIARIELARQKMVSDDVVQIRESARIIMFVNDAAREYATSVGLNPDTITWDILMELRGLTDVPERSIDDVTAEIS